MYGTKSGITSATAVTPAVLPFTGANVYATIITGIALLMLGLTVLMLSRRARRRAAEQRP